MSHRRYRIRCDGPGRYTVHTGTQAVAHIRKDGKRWVLANAWFSESFDQLWRARAYVEHQLAYRPMPGKGEDNS